MIVLDVNYKTYVWPDYLLKLLYFKRK